MPLYGITRPQWFNGACNQIDVGSVESQDNILTLKSFIEVNDQLS